MRLAFTILAFAVAQAITWAAEPHLPKGYKLLYEQTFEQPESIKEFQMTDAAVWKYSKEEQGGGALELAAQSNYKPEVRSPVNIALIKGFSVHGVRAGEYGRQFPEKGAENDAAIWKLAEGGLVKPRVDAEYPLDSWREAFETLAQRKVVG